MRATAPAMKAVDVWNVLVTAITTPLSIGEALNDYTAIRAVYLDNIDADLKELFYEHFAFTVDDLTGVVASGTATAPTNLVDNDITTNTTFALNQYVELNLGHVAYIKRLRFYGDVNSQPDNRYRLQAYVAGAWEDCLTNIVDIDADAWSSWLNLTAPRASNRWRFECTLRPTGAGLIGEIELDGVSLG